MIPLNLAVRFLLELAGMAALAAAVVSSVPGPPGWLLAASAVAAVAVLWGRVAAPRADNGLSQANRQLAGSGILLAIATLLALTGRPVLGAAFAAAIVINTAALRALGATDVTAAVHAGVAR